MSLRFVLALACCAACSPATPVVPDPTPTFTRMTPPPATPSAFVLWTSPPMASFGPAAPPLPPLATFASPLTTAPPLRSAGPPPHPSPAASPDPFRWSGYRIDDGPVLYVPASWTVIPAASSQGLFRFAASPEPARGSTIAGYGTLLTLSYLSVTPSMSVEAFADAVARTFPASSPPLQERGTHPSGTVVFLKYAERAAIGRPAQHVDAILVARGRAYILAARSPADLWPRFAPTFMRAFERFSPA